MNSTREPFSTRAWPRAAARWGLARAGRPESTGCGALLQPAVIGGQGGDVGAADHRHGVEVEAVERLVRRQPGVGQMPLDASARALGELVFGESGQEAGGGPALPVGCRSRGPARAGRWSAGAVRPASAPGARHRRRPRRAWPGLAARSGASGRVQSVVACGRRQRDGDIRHAADAAARTGAASASRSGNAPASRVSSSATASSASQARSCASASSATMVRQAVAAARPRSAAPRCDDRRSRGKTWSR